MVEFVLTPALRTTIEQSSLAADAKKELLKNNLLSRASLVGFYSTCKPTSTLLTLLRQTKMKSVDYEDSAPRPKTAEFLESMELLRRRAQEEEYQKLLNPRPGFGTLYEPKFDDEAFNASRLHKETKSHVTTIFNIFISVASVMYAIWYWTDTSYRFRDVHRVLLCLFFGLLILAAEVVIYMGYLRKVEEARTKERSKVEHKKVVRTFTL